MLVVRLFREPEEAGLERRSLKFKRTGTSSSISRKKIKLKTNANIGNTGPKPLPKGGLKLKRRTFTADASQRAKSRPTIKKESIYGLDVDFLRQIGKEDVIKVLLYL